MSTSMPITFPLYVVAHNDYQAKDWFRRTFPERSVRLDMRYVDRFDKLQGITNATLVKLGGYYLRNDFDDFQSVVKYLEQVGRLKVYYESDFQEEQAG